MMSTYIVAPNANSNIPSTFRRFPCFLPWRARRCNPPADSQAARAGMLIRMDSEVFSAIQVWHELAFGPCRWCCKPSERTSALRGTEGDCVYIHAEVCFQGHRINPHVFVLLYWQDLDQGGFIAVSAAKPRATPLPSSPTSSVAPTPSGAASSSAVTSVPGSLTWPTALEFHVLSRASGEDG